MKRSTALLLTLGAEALAAYFLLRQDPFFSGKAERDNAQSDIEQVVGKKQDELAEIVREQSTKRPYNNKPDTEEITTGEQQGQDGPAPPTLPDMYSLWKQTLEHVLHRDLRSLYHGYEPSERQPGDFYVVEAGEELTVKLVRNPINPTIHDSTILTITREDDGSYTAATNKVIFNEEDPSGHTAYVMTSGSQEDIHDRIPHIIEWQKRFEDIMQEAQDAASNKHLSQRTRAYYYYLAYEQGCQDLEAYARDHGFPLDPLALETLHTTVTFMKERLEEVERNEQNEGQE